MKNYCPIITRVKNHYALQGMYVTRLMKNRTLDRLLYVWVGVKLGRWVGFVRRRVSRFYLSY